MGGGKGYATEPERARGKVDPATPWVSHLSEWPVYLTCLCGVSAAVKSDDEASGSETLEELILSSKASGTV